jgi:hypothetical protein
LRLRGRALRVHSTNLIGGVLFLAMGGLILVLAATGVEVVAFPGQNEFSAAIHQATDTFLIAVNGLPALVLSVLLVVFAVYLVRRARRPSSASLPEVPDEST